jgi:hypothetical protein
MEADLQSPPPYPSCPQRASQTFLLAGTVASQAFSGEVRRFHLEQLDRIFVVEKIPEDRLSPDRPMWSMAGIGVSGLS